MSEWEACLALYTVRNLVPEPRSLITVNNTDTLNRALTLLEENNLQCLPVIDPEDKGRCVGLIDTVDILFAAAGISQEEGTSLESLAQPRDTPSLHILDTRTVAEFCNVSGRNACCMIYEGLPLSSIMDVLSTRTQIHRVPVIDKQESLIGMVSQCRCLEFLKEKVFPSLPELLLTARITELDYMKDVFTITAQATVYEGYKDIITKGVHGLAVVDKNNCFVGTLTASDVRIPKGGNMFKHMQMRIGDHLQEKGRRPIYCMDLDTVGIVANRMLANHIHRIFVVDNPQSLSLKGVISFGDILLYLKNLGKIGL